MLRPRAAAGAGTVIRRASSPLPVAQGTRGEGWGCKLRRVPRSWTTSTCGDQPPRPTAQPAARLLVSSSHPTTGPATRTSASCSNLLCQRPGTLKGGPLILSELRKRSKGGLGEAPGPPLPKHADCVHQSLAAWPTACHLCSGKLDRDEKGGVPPLKGELNKTNRPFTKL